MRTQIWTLKVRFDWSWLGITILIGFVNLHQNTQLVAGRFEKWCTTITMGVSLQCHSLVKKLGEIWGINSECDTLLISAMSSMPSTKIHFWDSQFWCSRPKTDIWLIWFNWWISPMQTFQYLKHFPTWARWQDLNLHLSAITIWVLPKSSLENRGSIHWATSRFNSYLLSTFFCRIFRCSTALRNSGSISPNVFTNPSSE